MSPEDSRTVRPGRSSRGGNLGRQRRRSGAPTAHTVVPTNGSPLIVGPRDRSQRIRDTVSDLQVVIDGCTAQPNNRLGDQAASLARHCSIFLRKLVLDDRNNRRLLDEDFCQTVGLRFDRLRRTSGGPSLARDRPRRCVRAGRQPDRITQ